MKKTSTARRERRAAGRAIAKGASGKAQKPSKGPLAPRVVTQIIGLVTTVVLALYCTTFSLQAFEIPSGSMEDTLLVGERVIVDKVAYARPDAVAAHALPEREPKLGDIIVFKFPPNPSVAYVKRVVGVPGDRLRLVRGMLQRNGQFVNEPYVVHKFGNFDAFRDQFPAVPPSESMVALDPRWSDRMAQYVHNGWIEVPPGHYFAMGDNRDNSLDSRYWGFVPRANILGRPVIVFWSLNATAEDFQYNSQFEYAEKWVARIVLFPFRARWHRMFLIPS